MLSIGRCGNGVGRHVQDQGVVTGSVGVDRNHGRNKSVGVESRLEWSEVKVIVAVYGRPSLLMHRIHGHLFYA
jgi:hypothetical protein